MDLTFRVQLATAVLVGLALGGILLASHRAGRASVRNALVLLLACAGAELLGASPIAPGYPRLARAVLDFASFGAGVALIRLALLTLYRLLAALHVRVVSLVEDLVTAALLLLWIFVWLRLAGVDLASLVATSAVITAVIAFAMQDTLGNILGGIVLQLDDSMRVGDWVQVDDIRGRVIDVRWRYPQPRNGVRAERRAHEESLHRDRLAQRPAGALATLGLVRGGAGRSAVAGLRRTGACGDGR